MSHKYVQAKKARLAAPIGDSDTSITLANFKDIYGNELAMSDFGAIGYGTIDPGVVDKEEIISFTGVTNNGDGTWTLTGVVRGLKAKSDYSTGGTAVDHSGNAKFIITNNPNFYNQFANKNNDETITGYWLVPDPVSATGIANRQWVLSVVTGGTISYNQVIEAGTAGEVVAAGNLVYFDTTDNEWKKTDADTVATLNNVKLGIAQGAGVDGGTISGGVLTFGDDTNQTGMTQGDLMYAGNTAGAITSSAGTNERVIGIAKTATVLFFDPYFYYTLTAAEKAAIAGSQGVVGSSNKLISQDNTTSSTTDQAQSTQNSSTETGEADATTKKNILAQSFTPTKTKIRGVKLYKAADTGAFTGSVVITLEANSGGSPSGTPLATCTLTNAQWLALATGEFDAIFASEYTSLVAGSLYWIVIDPSTSDNSNHPNIGTNTAGGYGSGSAKYKNTADGWVAISTIDLYFKTLEGTVSQVVTTDTDGYQKGVTKVPTITVLDTVTDESGSSSTQFDITNPSGTTFRYTWDGTGTDPVINATTVPIGSLVNLQGQNFAAGNKGLFVVTNVGTNFFEVTNASGVAENNVTVGTGYIVFSGTNWFSKPDKLSFLEIELVGGGGGGETVGNQSGKGGAGGGGLRKALQGSSVAMRIPYIIGAGGATGKEGRITAFGTYYATGGQPSGGVGGLGVGGDLNVRGGVGGGGGAGSTGSGTSNNIHGGPGGNSLLGGGGSGGQTETQGGDGGQYGGGGGGGADDSSGTTAGGAGAKGAIVLKATF